MVSVIIPTFRDWDRLQRCIDALREQTLESSKFEIIVVNNDPSDSQPLWFSLPENTVLVSESVRGSYAARNRGISAAHGTILAFTDSDCIPTPNWLETALRHFTSTYQIHRVCGPVELLFTGQKLTPAETYERVKGFAQERNATRGTAVTANMFAKRSVFDRVGIFPSSFLSGGDIEWGRLAQAHGFGIEFEPEAIVLHPARNRLKQLSDKSRRVATKDYRALRSGAPGKRYLSLFWTLRPRLKAFPQYLRKSESSRDAILAFCVGWWLSVVRVHEVLRLIRGNSKYS